MERCTGYTITLRRSHDQPDWAICALRKWFWAVSTGTRSRPIAETWVHVGGHTEGEVLEACLADLTRTLADQMG